MLTEQGVFALKCKLKLLSINRANKTLFITGVEL